jgi:hypothetical protein
MDNFDQDPLDLLEDDGDGVIETILLEDEEGRTASRNSGCAVLLLGFVSSMAAGGWVVSRLFS